MSIRSTIFTVVCLVSVCVLMSLPGTFGEHDNQENDHKLILQLQREMATLKHKLHNYEEKIEEYEKRLVQNDGKWEELELTAQLNDVAASSSGGATFTRWGRSLCQPDLDRVYSGLMARNNDGNTGGGVDFQCLPHFPEYATYMDGYQYGTPGRGLIHGTEYQGNPDEIFDHDNLADTTFINNDAPCAVCHITNRTSVIMIPAQTSCPTGWTDEYWGYLVSSAFGAAGPSMHVCMDHAPEVVNGAGDVHNTAAIYHVEIICGPSYSLPCPNYIDGRELTCVVCSK